MTLQIPLNNNTFHKHLLVQIIENLSSGGARGSEDSLLELSKSDLQSPIEPESPSQSTTNVL